MQRTLVRRIARGLLALGLLGGVVGGLAPPDVAPGIGGEPREPLESPVVFSRLPDLWPHVHIAPDTLVVPLPGHFFTPHATVTVTVESLFTTSPITQGLEVAIQLPPLLRQVGGITAGGGFQCANMIDTLGMQNIRCTNGSIVMGDRAHIVFDVVAPNDSCFPQNVRVQTDPRHQIAEASETNNEASAAIAFVGCTRGPCPVGGPYGPGNWPPAPCWRPYSNSSPFNTPVSPAARELKNSAAIVQQLIGDTAKHPGNLVVNVDGHAGEPTYYSQATDPEYTLHCTMALWGTCPLEGVKIRIPEGAAVESNLPAAITNSPAYQGQPDAHLTVVDQSTGWEYDLYQVHRSPIRAQDGAVLAFSWGGLTRIDGDGTATVGGATVARFGSLAGRIRAEELAVRRIDHALAVVVPCVNGFIYPARDPGRSQTCTTTTDGPPLGARLHLNLPANTIADLRAAGVPEWKLAILNALATYGAYINDTGSSHWFTLEQEAGSPYMLFGEPNRWVTMASSNPGWFYKPANAEPTYPPEHWAGIFRTDADGINWRDRVWQHLRVVFPSFPSTITIRGTDPSEPLIGMDTHSLDPTLPRLTVTDGMPNPPSMAVKDRTVITLTATGTDGESGIQATEIWTEVTVLVGPGIEITTAPAALRASNTDPAAKTAGAEAVSQRLTSHNVDFAQLLQPFGPQRMRVVAWAIAQNYHGQRTETARFTMERP